MSGALLWTPSVLDGVLDLSMPYRCCHCPSSIASILRWSTRHWGLLQAAPALMQ